MSRNWALLLFLIMSVVLTGCTGGGSKVTLFNSSDTLVCFHVTSAHPGCSAEVKPHAKTTWATDCYTDDQRQTVILTDPGGTELYSLDASCGEWADAGSTLIIKQDGGDLIVVDSLPSN